MAVSSKGPPTKKKSSWFWTLVPMVVFGVSLQALCVQMDLPVGNLIRNLFASSKPAPVTPKYSSCGDLSKQLTVVVTVKDACSQLPGFVEALKPVVGRDTALILTYPNLKSCDPKSLGVDVDSWRSVRTIPLPPHSSPMKGWVEAAPMVDTKYSLLMHNDGYAIDDFFACELVNALEDKSNQSYVAAAPMLYESKADGSLAAHATQTRLRMANGVVRHDHSLARALNRGQDYGEGEQEDFLEDHGFLIQTDKITTIIDPSASYTLEYIDMILSLKSRDWKVLFVPTARLEFRIAEFSWRDVAYFMYKRSEATCHGTRDYLAAKWGAAFPNTGFWTYIKYTIVESHEYPESELAGLPWDQQAALFLGFFQLAGYNRYQMPNGGETSYVSLLQDLDTEKVTQLGTLKASRVTLRPEPREVRNATPAKDLLPTVENGWLPTIEADMPLEYLPFAVAELKWPQQSCDAVLGNGADADLLENKNVFPKHLCGVAAQHKDGCSCWINLPTFKSHSRTMTFLASVASLMKLPSRVTTYLEMVLGSSNKALPHVAGLKEEWTQQLNTTQFRVMTCGGAKTSTSPIDEPCDPISFHFDDASTVVHFSGRPATPNEIAAALRSL